ncbi:MAG: sigma-70 family RNA polymerase sigma factor [Planctomycetaceae bacterium]|nr:sigma-70 family RNA polymerase sigma factor [Planctomycetaceae bacterium]
MPHNRTFDSESASDEELLRQFEAGKEDAATGLYFRYARRLFGLIRHQMSPMLQRRVEADEIVQSVFRSFFRRARAGQYDVPEGNELWSLLLVMTLNKIRTKADYHTAQRRDVRKTSVQKTQEIDRFASVAGAGDEEALVMLQLVIDDLLEHLQPQKAEMIRLRISGWEVQEIADQTKRSKRTVERTLQEFRDRLTTELSEISDNDDT